MSTELLVILLCLAAVAGIAGYIAGRQATSIGCLWYVLALVLFGPIGLIFFAAGAMLGRNVHRDVANSNRSLQPWNLEDRSTAFTGVMPNNAIAQARAPTARDHAPFDGSVAGFPMAMPLPEGRPVELAPIRVTPAVGWKEDPTTPGLQWYWDGSAWTHGVRWNGSAWEPV